VGPTYAVVVHLQLCLALRYSSVGTQVVLRNSKCLKLTLIWDNLKIFVFV